MLSLLLITLSRSAVIGIDIGSETIKAGIFRKKIVEVILNEQSKRLTDALVAFDTNKSIELENIKDIDRRIGYSANAILMKNQSAVFRGFTEILGKTEDDEINAHLDRRMYGINMKNGTINGIDPLIPLAMLFERIIKNAEVQFGKDDYSNVVIAVPPFFTEVQKMKVIEAAEIVNLNVLRIIDAKTVAAYTYAHEKLSFFVREPKSVAFIDFGVSKITISGYKFSATYENRRGVNPRPQPKVEELFFTWDDTIGGIDFDVLIAKDIQQKYQLPTVDYKLLLDAKKIKHSLTLNDKANETIDALNRKIVYTREEFYNSCKEIFDKLENLAKSVNMTFDNIEFLGGASRVLKVQEIFEKYLGNITKYLNNDEAVLYGATLYGAILKDLQRSEITLTPLNNLAVNVSFGDESKMMIQNNVLTAKTKTARFDNTNKSIPEIVVYYGDRFPIGCTNIIGKWSIKIMKDGGRLSFIFSVTQNGILQLSKAQLFHKSESGSQQIVEVDYNEQRRPYYISKEDRDGYKLILSKFSENDRRLYKINEAKNEFDAVLFALKNNMSDKVFLSVINPLEMGTIRQKINDTIKWSEENKEFEDEKELIAQKNKVIKYMSSIVNRATEKKGRGPAIQELDYLLNDMQEAVLDRWKKQKLHVPKAQKKAILTHIKQTREWLTRMMNEQEELEEYDEPILTCKMIELRVKKLSSAYKELEEAVLTNKIKSYRDEDDEDIFGADL